MASLSQTTDLDLWRNGLVTLRSLTQSAPVLGGPEHRWCWSDSHNYRIVLSEDEVRYSICSRCHHVKRAASILSEKEIDTASSCTV